MWESMRLWLVSAVALLGPACGPEMYVTLQPDASVPGPDAADPVPYPDAPACAQSVPIMIQETVTPPDVLLVVDKSGSMDERLHSSSSSTKWQIMRDALRQIVEAEDQDIYFGLSLFPSNNSCGAGTISVEVAAGNASAIVNRLNQVTDPDGSTPTHTTLIAAANYYSGRPVNPNGRFVLLATDGEPNCGPGGQNDETDTESVQAVELLMGLGIKTYVIGFGSGTQTNPTTLENMATAGGTAPYFQASSAADLQQALEAISGSVILPSCEYALQTEPDNAMRITVNFDGTPVGRTSSHTNGYSAATNSITFYGSACQELQSGTVMNVGVDYGCEGLVVD
jgi:hypothetical protein